MKDDRAQVGSPTPIFLYDTTTLFSANSTSSNNRYMYHGMEAAIGGDTNNLWLYSGTGNYRNLNDTGVAMLPGSDFGFKPKKMLTRLSYTDFDGVEFFRNVTNCKMIDDEMIKKYAPNVVDGVTKLSNWVKNL